MTNDRTCEWVALPSLLGDFAEHSPPHQAPHRPLVRPCAILTADFIQIEWCCSRLCNDGIRQVSRMIKPYPIEWCCSRLCNDGIRQVSRMIKPWGSDVYSPWSAWILKQLLAHIIA